MSGTPHLAGAEVDLDAQSRFYAGLLDTPAPCRTFVADDAGSIVGFVVARASDATGGGVIDALYVDPAWWGRGVARALHTEAVAHLRACGFTDATVWVIEQNARARRFYEAAGWRAHLETRTIRIDDLAVLLVAYRLALA